MPASAKDLIVRPIEARTSIEFIQKHHYSGKYARNTQVHLGVFLAGSLEGVMQFGPPLDRRKMSGIIKGGATRSMLELNRMAFTEALPRNSESRAIGVAMRLIRKHAPHVRFVVSFADAAQCGDGTIYRASGFVLTGIKPNANLVRLPDGTVIHKMTLESSPSRARPELGGRSYYDVTGGSYDFKKYAREVGGEVVPGFQLRYVKVIDPTAELAVPVIPFSKIDEIGARMYRGERPAE